MQIVENQSTSYWIMKMNLNTYTYVHSLPPANAVLCCQFKNEYMYFCIETKRASMPHRQMYASEHRRSQGVGAGGQVHPQDEKYIFGLNLEGKS